MGDRRRFAAVCLAAIAVAACRPAEPAPGSGSSPCDLFPGDPRFAVARVDRVVDGDTIEVTLDGRQQRVRYIGIDAPESVKPDWPVEYYGPEASDYNKKLVGGRDICLEKDVSETDRFGRLLRYAYIGDTFVNDKMIRDGYARAVTFPPDVKYVDLLRAAEREARDAGRGLWGRP